MTDLEVGHSSAVEVIDEREESSMASCWTIRLCLQRNGMTGFRLFNGRYSEHLGDQEDYFNEDTEEYDIPDAINGIEVEDVDDGMILGGPLIWTNREDVVEFDDLGDTSVSDWLRDNHWTAPNIVTAIADAIATIP